MDNISAIRNDNADALDEAVKERKRARSATPRASAQRASTPSAAQINKEIGQTSDGEGQGDGKAGHACARSHSQKNHQVRQGESREREPRVPEKN
jgi:hypothetical protein